MFYFLVVVMNHILSKCITGGLDVHNLQYVQMVVVYQFKTFLIRQFTRLKHAAKIRHPS